MKVKTYRAPTIKQALEEVKKELGPDAFILGRKEIQPKKLLGIFGRKYFEVAAAVDYSHCQKETPSERGMDWASATDKIELSQAATAKVEAVKARSFAKPRRIASSSEKGNRALLNEIRNVK